MTRIAGFGYKLAIITTTGSKRNFITKKKLKNMLVSGLWSFGLVYRTWWQLTYNPETGA